MRNRLTICRILTILLILSLGSGSGMAATIYKWIDEDGNVQYSQNPPPGNTQAEVIKPPPRPVDADAASTRLEQQQAFLDESREARQEAGAEAQAKREEMAVNKQRCEQARKHLASYQRPRVNVVGDDGERRRATEEERQSQLVKAREMVDRECN